MGCECTTTYTQQSTMMATAPLQKMGASLRTLSNHHRRLRESSEVRRGRRHRQERRRRRRLGEMESAWA